MNQLITVNLTDSEKKAFEKLPENLKQFAAARIGNEIIKKITDFTLKTECAKIITIAYSELGQFGITPEMLDHQKNALFTELRNNSKFWTMTLPEVQNAFKIGIRGESGPFFGLCSKTYHQFLKFYFEKKERVESLSKFLDELKKPTTSNKPVAIKFTEDKNSVINAFDDYIETGSLPFACSRHYFFLWKEAGIVNWNQEEKNEIEAEAKEKYISKLKKQLFNREISKQTFEKCTFNIDSSNASFINLCREIALKKLFDKLKNENKHLKTLFDDKGI